MIDVLDVRGGKLGRSNVGAEVLYKFEPLRSVGTVRCTAGTSEDGDGPMSSPLIGISPEVGVFEAKESLEGDIILSPRSRACVDGDS